MKMFLLYVMSAFYILAGLNHFRNPGFYLPMMPPWIPGHKRMIFLSGLAEVILGGLLLWPPAREFAAWGIVIMLILFFSVHVYMYQERNTVFRKIPNFIIIARLPLQFVLIYWAYLYT